MTKDRELLPWVLGGILAFGAVAAIAGAPAAPTPAVSGSTTQAAQGAPATAHPAVPADSSPVTVATKARPQLPPGQVWECDVNGQRVFSDVQCGTHATVRQLTELNLFDPRVADGRSPPRPYGYGSSSGYYPPPMPPSEAPPDEADAGGGDPIYSQVIVVHDRAWHLAHHDHSHPRGAPHHP